MDYTKEDFINHLDKVCKVELIKKLCLDFYHDFCDFYKGKEFIPTNFEQILLYNTPIEQDIIHELDVHNSKLTAGKLLTYMFVKHVKEIELKKDLDVKSCDGLYFFKLKKISLKIPDFFHEIDLDDTHQVIIKKIDNFCKLANVAKAEKLRTLYEKKFFLYEKESIDELKHALYHEFGHVLEMKTFGQELCYKSDFSEILHLPYMNKEMILSDKSNNLTQPFSSKFNLNHIPSYQLKIFREGQDALTETLNEQYCCKIGKFTFENNNLSDYNQNSDILAIFKGTVFDCEPINIKFNPKLIINNFNTINISNELMDICTTNFFDTIKQYFGKDLPQQIKQEILEVENILNACSNYDVLTFMLGAKEIILQTSENSNLNKLLNANILDFLITLFSEKIFSQIYHGNPQKNNDYYQRLNSALIRIDKCIPKLDSKKKNIKIQNFLNKNDLFTTKNQNEAMNQNRYIVNYNEMITELNDFILSMTIKPKWINELTIFTNIKNDDTPKSTNNINDISGEEEFL